MYVPRAFLLRAMLLMMFVLVRSEGDDARSVRWSVPA